MKGGHFSPGQAYVAFSRVKKLEGLHVNFNPKANKASDNVKEEMARLAQNLLCPLPLFTPPNHSYTIALLNVRSILPKLPDIDCDSSRNRQTSFAILKPGLHPTLTAQQ